MSNLTPGDYTLTWGPEPGWNTPTPASQTKTLAAGGKVTFSGTYTVIAVPETISTPDPPAGPATGVENQDLSYIASGALSNVGDDVEYRYDWGDGSFSDWDTSAVQNSWATAGTYEVKAQARCIDHPAIVSGWSSALTVTITVFTVETVSTPDAPTGAASIEAGQSSPYTASGAISSYGDDLQYRLDWGDGQISAWSTSTTVSHAWATEGTYEVKAQARCNTHRTIESAWSAATTVTVTAATAETVSTPDAPSGPASGETNESLTYTASGAVSSFGHLVEYRFDFGGGGMTGWLNTVTSRSYAWTSAGTYEVKVQARCRTHPAIESAWSPATTVTISEPAEIIPSPPGTINGVAAGIINDPYDYTCYHSSTTNLGDPVEGQFDWGDGTTSAWISPGPYTSTHTWPNEGTYVVKYKARCSVHPEIFALAESLVVTITTTAVETISTPGFVNYSYSQRNPEINVPRTYYVYGGTSSLGHDTEVKVDWGDGTQTDWVPHASAVTKTWTVAGTYSMIRQSRCADHPEILSAWSAPITFNALEPETVSTPVAPPGPTTGFRYEYLYYTARGAESSWHGDSWMEYRFDWGDGSALTAWSRTDTIQRHRYTTMGTFEVKTQARCAYSGHGAPESAWSPPTVVNIVEKITVQYGPSGPDHGAVNESNTFEAYSATSDVGHAVEYQFDWGDGTYSGWSASKSADHTFTATGSYDLYYRARCAVDTIAVSDWSSQYHTIIITADPEAVSTPDQPAQYPTTPASVGDEIQFSTTGSFSNHGHPVEFQFDYGDGFTSAWTAGTLWGGVYQLSLPHTFTAVGTYNVTCKARCATHPAVESAISAARTIEVYENIDAPAVPTGPTSGLTGANLTFTTTGTTSSEGHALEYSFEYRQGTYSVIHTSDWSSSLSDDYVFTQAGSYRVRVRARCATDTGAVSTYSGFLDITITDSR